MNIEVFRELIQYGLASIAGTSSYLTPWRTQTAIDTGDYAGDALSWVFEIVAKNTDSAARTVELVYSTTINDRTTLNSVASISVPASTTSGTRFSVTFTFTPYSGLGYYYVRLQGTTSASQVTVTEARVRVLVTGATKAVVEVPLASANYGSTSNVDDKTIFTDRLKSTSWSRGDSSKYSRWLYTAAEWADIVDVKVHHILSATSGYSAYSGIVQAGTTTLLTGSDTPANTTTTPNLVIATVSAADLTDSTEYEGAIKGSSSAQYAYAYAVSLLVRLSNAAGLSKLPIWLQVGRQTDGSTGALDFRAQRAQLVTDNYSGTVTYATEVTGYDATSESTYGIADLGTSDSSGATGAMSGTQVTLPSARGRVRTSSWTPPTSGNRVAGYKPASTGTPPEAAIFVVITVVGSTGNSAGGGLTAKALTFSGSATNTPPARTASGGLSARALTFSGSATNVPPPNSASGGLTTARLTFAGTAVHQRNASGGITTAHVTFSGSATNVPPARSASGGLSAALLAFAGSATNVPPARSASGGLSAHALTFAGAATNTPPARTASGGLSSAHVGFSGSAANVPPARSADGGLAAKSLAFAGGATNVPPARSASGGLSATALRFAGAATNVPPARSADGAFTTARLGFSGTATNTPPSGNTASGNLQLAGLDFAGAATNVPPARSASGGITVAHLAFAGGATSKKYEMVVWTGTAWAPVNVTIYVS
jgi:hypothetical protein